VDTVPKKKFARSANVPVDSERPDAWQRFEQAVDQAVKHGPEHREPTQPPKRQRIGANKRRDKAT
jgi:hypothetical protein